MKGNPMFFLQFLVVMSIGLWPLLLVISTSFYRWIATAARRPAFAQ